jgi:hypothetical protein
VDHRTDVTQPPGRTVTDVIASWWHPAMVPMTRV